MGVSCDNIELILAFFGEYGILYEFQFGFTKNHCTSTAITHFSDELLMNMDMYRLYSTISVVFIDFSIAFDTFVVEILLSELKHLRSM